uniref:RING-type domain-containing protein n=1 Tax=Kalanchoe fedtschenkoi TaxID=63787 RepID=A0A7N0TGZ1_KALFE
MPITARRDSDGAIQGSNRHQHASAAAASASSTTTQRQAKLPSAGVLSIILRAVIMCVLTSLFFLCVALATILLIHVFLAGRQLRRRRRRRTPPPTRHSRDALSREDLSLLAEFCYLKRDRTPDSDPECVICLERFRDGARYRILPGCGHAFHSNCIDAWLVKAAVCPICRASVRLNAAEAALSADQSGKEK